MEVLKKYKSQLYFHLILNIACAVFVTLASFVHYPLAGFNGYLFYTTHFLALQFSVFGFLYLLSLNRYVFMLLFPVLFVLFSVAGYWVYFHDIAISQGIIHVTLDTTPDIAYGLISFPFIIYTLLSVVVCLLILRLYGKLAMSQWKSPMTLLAVIGILSYFAMEEYKHGAFTRRLPYNAVYAIREFSHRNALQLKPVPPVTARASLNIVFILGESVRADHMQLNGYTRQTNPLLSKRPNIITFPDTYTPFTYTAESLPQILTDATFTDDYSQPKYSLIDVLNHANIASSWIGNQTPEKSFEMFIKQARFNTIIDPMHSELSFVKAYDDQLLPVFKDVFNPAKNQFTVLHMMGSHWWYETRYPEAFRRFRPVIDSKHITSNSRQQMINSYDNTILYLDYFIDATIQHVQHHRANTLVIYLSDHGEMLGEDDMWLHAQNGNGVSNTAMLIWYSDEFNKNYPEVVRQLQSKSRQRVNLDFFFPSILDLYGIDGIQYDKSKSLLR